MYFNGGFLTLGPFECVLDEDPVGRVRISFCKCWVGSNYPISDNSAKKNIKNQIKNQKSNQIKYVRGSTFCRLIVG